MNRLLMTAFTVCCLSVNALIASDENSEVPLLKLPTENISGIIDYLDPRSRARTMGVCTLLNAAGTDPLYWQLHHVTATSSRGSRLPPYVFSLQVINPFLGRTFTDVISELPLSLRKLDLSNCGIGNVGAQQLGRIRFANLTDLNLSSNGLKAGNIIDLQSFWTDSLTSLDLSNNPIGNNGVISLAAFSLKGLTTLNLSKTKVGLEGINALGPLLIESLQNLNLSNNNLRDDGAIALATQPLGKLISLDISRNSITFDGGDFLVQQLSKGLKRLSLRGNHIGPTELEISDELYESLECLDLRDNYVHVMDASGYGTVLAHLSEEQLRLQPSIREDTIGALVNALRTWITHTKITAKNIGVIVNGCRNKKVCLYY